MGLTEKEWQLASHKATVIGVIIGIISLVFIAGAFQFTLMQLQSSFETTENLADLVESNQEQTKALQNTIEEIQHQTIVNAYANGGNFDVKFERCSFSNHYDQDENFIGTWLNIKPIMVTEKGAQTIVPFYVFIEYEFSGYNTEREKYDSRFDDYDADTFVYNIGTEASSQQINIQPYLDEAKNRGYTKIKIVSEYDFRPFSPIKEISLGDQTGDKEIDLAIMELKENGLWHVLDFREKYPCR